MSVSEPHISGSPLLLSVRTWCMHGHDVIPQIQQQSYFYGVRATLAKYFQPAARCIMYVNYNNVRTKSSRSSRGKGANTTVRERTVRAENQSFGGEGAKPQCERERRGRRLATEASEEREQRLLCESKRRGRRLYSSNI